ncbi:fibronectin type III domain-containing protein [candidate division WOR-3 bacterium]|nr:fibronectin type III domain-containing protein [candidate division WOR-3 bacterium]
MKRHNVNVWLGIVILLFAQSAALAESCTIAAASGSATVDGRALLWKNRDRSDAHNQEVRYFNDGAHGGYITIVTTGSGEATTAYAGVNDEGFAIVNSDAPDLNNGSPQNDGPFMKQALMECGSVADFESLLIATSGNRGHIWSNFGVIDSSGAAAIFETDDWDYVRYDADSSGGFVVRTNFSFWGGGTPGSRYDRAYFLISDAANTFQLDYSYIVQVVSKDIGGPSTMPCGEWPTTDPAISRYRTRSAAVVHGVLPAEDARLTTYWCILGEPSCGVYVPLWSYAGTPPYEMSTPGDPAPMCAEIQEKELYCYQNLTEDETINTNALVGDDGTSGIHGYSFPIEDETFDDTDAILAEWRAIFPLASEMAQFESERASRTYTFFDNEIAPDDVGRPNRDIAISGTQSGSYLDTWVSDNVYESIEERQSTGNPRKRYSYLEHKWNIFVEAGNQVTFYVEAHHTDNLEGDDFIFAYSADDINYTDMLVVTKTTDDDECQVYAMPPSVSGNVYVRVQDTDQSKGNNVLDAIFIDYIFVESSTIPDTTPPVISNVASSGVTSSSAVITWDTDEYSNSVVRYDTDGGPDYDFVSSNADLVLSHDITLTGLSPSTQYYYIVESTDASNNTAASAEHSFTTGAGGNELHVFNIGMTLRQNGPFTRGITEVTIVDADDIPVAEATIEGHWSGLANDTDQFTTESNGVGSCDSDKIKYAAGWFVFTIDNVFKDGWTYNPAANVETTDSISVGGGGPQTAGIENLPATFALNKNHPNPFSARTVIRYALPVAAGAKMIIYDVCGRVVRVLVDTKQEAGYYEASWDGRDERNREVTSGVYFVKLMAGDNSATEKVLLMK